jgi:UDP-N-acetyl-2-amino-2-deoxyglucuronate dehydrogenase
MTDPVGVALVGTGAWAARIAEAVPRAGNLRLVTCFSPDEERCEGFARAHGCEAAATLGAALAHPEVAAVVIATPNDLHAPQALAAAAAGLHVLVEKPIADTVAAAEAMRDAFAGAGLVLAVGHEMRRLGAARRVRELLDAGVLGRVVLAEANWSLPGRLTPEAWRWYRRRAPGGPLLQLGIHHADTLAYWLGPVARTTGAFARLVTEAEIDDVGVATLELAGGALATITGSYVSPRTYFLRLYGTIAALDYEVDMAVWPHADRVDGATTLTLRDGDGARPVEFERRDPLAEQLREFGRAVRGDGMVEVRADEGIGALRVILDAVGSPEPARV